MESDDAGQPRVVVKQSFPAYWRSSLLASLDDTGVTRLPLNRFSLLLAPVLLTGILILAFAFVRSWYDSTIKQNNAGDEVFATALFLVAAGIAGAMYSALNRQIRRVLARTGQQAVAHDLRRPILYLRSFAFERARPKRTWFEMARTYGTGAQSMTPEELAVRRVRSIGPVIAIGHPGEQLPPLGAARFYVSDDKWQSKIAQIAAAAELTLWISGTTPGLRWELGHLLGNLAPETLIVWAHPHLLRLRPNKREEEWREFLRNCGELFPKPLPERLGETRFFHFDADFTPHAVAPNEYGWGDAEDGALQILLRRKGQGRTRRWFWRSRLWVLRPVFGLLCGVAAYLVERVVSGLSEVLIQLARGLIDPEILGFYLSFDAVFYFLMGIHAVLGLLFVAAQPLLPRCPGGYKVGAAAAGILLTLLYAVPIDLYLFARGTMAQPGSASIIAGPTWLQIAAARALWTLFSGAVWGLVTAALLRLLPWGPGRPPRP